MTSFQNLTLTRQYPNHSDVIRLDRDGLEERWISVRRTGTDELSVFDAFSSAPDQIVAQMVFGGLSHYEGARTRMGGAEWPLLWLQGDVCPGHHVSGAQAFLIPGQTLRRVRLDDRIVGTLWSDADADYCLLAGILPADLTAPRGSQTRSCFEQIETALQHASMDFSQ